MKKKRLIGMILSIFLTLLILPVFAVPVQAAGNVTIDSVTFPDPVFRDYVTNTLNGGSSVLTPEKIATIQGINVSGRDVSNLKGIEYFTALRSLNCSETQVTSLNTGYNGELVYLYCISCSNLTYLNVSSCTKLESIYCYNSSISNLVLTNTPALITLECDRNSLTSLNLSGHTKLQSLECYGNNLSSLNVSGCTALRRLWCYENPLNGLNVSTCTALTNLQCYSCGLTSLDVSANMNLQNLNCRDNKLTSLDVSGHGSLNSLFVNQNPRLRTLNCSSCALYELNTADCPALEVLFCDNNALTSLGTVSGNTALKNLHCHHNSLTALNVSADSALEYLYCHDNQLTTLMLPYGSALKHVYCYNNELASLNVANNPELEHLSCYGNSLTSLDVTRNPKLTVLNCGINQLGSLNLSKNTQLTYLVCSNNQLGSLDVSKLTQLLSLECDQNQLTALDVTKNTKLYLLDCAYNSIQSLNITTCSGLVAAYDTTPQDYGAILVYESGSNVLRVDKSTGVSVVKSPIILKDPANKTVADGITAKFTVQAFGSGVKYQWQYSKDNGQTWKDCSSTGNNTATLTFTAAVNHDDRLYRCRAYNSYGSVVSGSAKLRVVGFKTLPSDQTAAPGEQVTFQVSAGGSPVFQWQYSKDNGSTWTDCSSTGYNKATFSFKAKASMDGRLYRCIISKGNTIAMTSEPAKLTVSSSSKPVISTQPANKTVANNKSVTFSVAATGSSLSYQWQYSKDNGSSWTDCTSNGSATASFSFTAKESMNGRLYRCKVTNSSGSVISNSAKLTISGVKPAITSQPANKTVTAGSTAKFTVAAAGTGLTYQWYYSKDNGATWTKCTSAGSDSAAFSFTAKASMTGRLYRCKVTNSSGSATSSSAKLTVKS